MSFAYPKNKHITLPSVEGPWGAMGAGTILRDPPKCVFTRKIDKVGDSSIVNEMIDESGDRFSEAIQIYSRGVNPFVSVSYSNYGTNGGQAPGSDAGRQAFYPHRVARDGAFRPPILRQEQLLPLSRLPRLWTSAKTNPEFPDFSKRQTRFKWAREIRPEVMKVCARPTATYNVETVKENFQINEIKDIPVISVASRKTFSKEIPNLNPDASLYINKRDIGSAQTNPFFNLPSQFDRTGIDIHTKDLLQFSTHAPTSSSKAEDYVNYDQITLQKKLPSHNFSTNIGSAENFQNVGSTTYKLPDKPKLGGFEGKGTMPILYREELGSNIDSRRSDFQKKINAEMEGRFTY